MAQIVKSELVGKVRWEVPAEGSSEAFERFDNLLTIMAEPHAEFIQRVQDEKAQAA